MKNNRCGNPVKHKFDLQKIKVGKFCKRLQKKYF